MDYGKEGGELGRNGGGLVHFGDKNGGIFADFCRLEHAGAVDLQVLTKRGGGRRRGNHGIHGIHGKGDGVDGGIRVAEGVSGPEVVLDQGDFTTGGRGSLLMTCLPISNVRGRWFPWSRRGNSRCRHSS